MSSDLLVTIGLNIRDARLARSLTQVQLAALAGISQRYLRDIEHGRANPRLSLIDTLASALETTPALLAQRKPF